MFLISDWRTASNNLNIGLVEVNTIPEGWFTVVDGIAHPDASGLSFKRNSCGVVCAYLGTGSVEMREFDSLADAEAFKKNLSAAWQRELHS